MAFAVLPWFLLVARSDADPRQVPGADVVAAGDADDGDVGVHCSRRHTHTDYCLVGIRSTVFSHRCTESDLDVMPLLSF